MTTTLERMDSTVRKIHARDGPSGPAVCGQIPNQYELTDLVESFQGEDYSSDRLRRCSVCLITLDRRRATA